MKTSELKRILSKDCVETFVENKEIIYGVFWNIWKKEQKLIIRGVVPLDVLKVLGEYHNTPISEREDEKRYYLEISKGVMKFIQDNDINVGFNRIALASSPVTQSEIENFPTEIKGAIECGFLRKVEVE